MVVVILITVIIPALLLREVSDNFADLANGRELWHYLLFIAGVYYYATGNGIHEMASFTFNTYCGPEELTNNLCGGLFFNDYFTGNIIYFVGGALLNTSLLLIEQRHPREPFNKRELIVLLTNCVVYSFAVFAYSAFDRVLVGLAYSFAMMLIALAIMRPVRKRYREHPFISYTVVVYTLGTVASAGVRFLR
jgi:uncharacterized membrane protein